MRRGDCPRNQAVRDNIFVSRAASRALLYVVAQKKEANLRVELWTGLPIGFIPVLSPAFGPTLEVWVGSEWEYVYLHSARL